MSSTAVCIHGTVLKDTIFNSLLNTVSALWQQIAQTLRHTRSQRWSCLHGHLASTLYLGHVLCFPWTEWDFLISHQWSPAQLQSYIFSSKNALEGRRGFICNYTITKRAENTDSLFCKTCFR